MPVNSSPPVTAAVRQSHFVILIHGHTSHITTVYDSHSNAGLYCGPYDNDNCLLIHRTLGMAELFE